MLASKVLSLDSGQLYRRIGEADHSFIDIAEWGVERLVDSDQPRNWGRYSTGESLLREATELSTIPRGLTWQTASCRSYTKHSLLDITRAGKDPKKKESTSRSVWRGLTEEASLLISLDHICRILTPLTTKGALEDRVALSQTRL